MTRSIHEMVEIARRTGDPELMAIALDAVKNSAPAKEGSGFGRALARTGRDAIQGLEDTAEIVTAPVRNLINLIPGAKIDPIDSGKHIDRATKGYTEPKTDTEKVVSSVTRAVSGLSPMGRVAKVATPRLSAYIKEFLGPSVRNLSSAAGASAAHQHVMNEDPSAHGKAAVASVVGGLTPHVVQRTGRKALEGIAKHLDTNALESFKKAGIDPSLGDVLKWKPAQQNAEMLNKRFGSSSVMQKHKAKQYQQIHKGLGNLAEEGADPGVAGDVAIGGAEKGLDAFKGLYKKRYDYVKDEIKKLESSLAGKYDPETGKEATKLEIIPFSIEKHKRGLPKSVREHGEKTHARKAIDKIIEHSNKGELDYHLADDKLKSLGRKIKHEVAHNKSADAETLHAYGLLRDDIAQNLGYHMEETNPSFKQKWMSTRSDYAQDMKDTVPHLNKILKPSRKSGEAGASTFRILAADIKNDDGRILNQVLKHLDTEGKELLNKSLLKETGKTVNGMSPTTIASAFNKLSEKSRTRILSHLPAEERQVFRSTIDAIGHSKELSKLANTSGTADHLIAEASRGNIAKGIGKAFSGVRSVDMQKFMDGIKAAAVDPLVDYSLGKLHTSPKVIEVLKKYKK